MTTTLIVLAVVTLALLSPGGAPVTVAQGPAATDILAVDAFIDAPRALFGRARTDVERALGPPASITPRLMSGGRRAPTDPVDELAYPGIVVALSRGSGRLRRVAITRDRWPLPAGLNIGTLREVIERRLGEPQATTDVSALYLYSDAYPDTVEFFFGEGRVRRIEWLYAPSD